MSEKKHQMQPRVKRVSPEVLKRVSIQAREKGFLCELTDRYIAEMAETCHEMISVFSIRNMVSVLVRLHTKAGEIIPLRLDLDFEIYNSIAD